MTPEEKARQLIDARLEQSGWINQDLSHVNSDKQEAVRCKGIIKLQ